MSANRELNHNHVALPTLASLKRKKCAVEVWSDTPAAGEPVHVTLGIEAKETEYVDLLPAEARAVAALLVAAAEAQERAGKPPFKLAGPNTLDENGGLLSGYGFHAEDYAHIAALMRANLKDDAAFRAILSNNFNVILGALDDAALAKAGSSHV